MSIDENTECKGIPFGHVVYVNVFNVRRSSMILIVLVTAWVWLACGLAAERDFHYGNTGESRERGC